MNELMVRHPITPQISSHDPTHLHIHAASKTQTVAELLVGESLLGLANLVCDLGPTRLGRCAATPGPDPARSVPRPPVPQRLPRPPPKPPPPLLLRPLLLTGQRRRLPRPAEGD